MIYQRKTSKNWIAAFYVKDANGKFIKRAISTKTDNKNKAKQIEQDLIRASKELAETKRINNFINKTAELITDQIIVHQGISIEILWDKFSKDISQATHSADTMNMKRIFWNRFYNWIKANYPAVETINDVSRDIAQAYIQTIQDKKASTFNNEKNCLSGIWQALTIQSGLKENVWRLFRMKTSDSVRYRDFSKDELQKILSNSNDFWKVAVAVGYYTGLRYKDVVFLKKSMIKKGYITLTPCKTKRLGKDVQIFMHPDLIKILDCWIANNSKSNTDYVFPAQVELYDNREFKSEFSELLKKCKIKANDNGIVGFHSLRHTFVTMCEEAGIERKVIQGIVGHGNEQMTGHYSHDKKSGQVISIIPSLLE